MKQSLVLIADIVASREIREGGREGLQQQLQEVLEELNAEGSGLISPYTITLGDEFQAVFENAEPLFSDIWKIIAELHPVMVRFSIGVGGIATPINHEQAIGMDGPAFHEAREGMEMLKKSGFLFDVQVEGDDSLNLKVMNGSLQLISQQVRSWKKNRFSILHMLSKGLGYKTVAKKLNISQSAFYKNKEAGSLDIINALCKNIAQTLNQNLTEE